MSSCDERVVALPMKILMPSLSPAMQEGTLARWLVAEGQAIRPGDVIAEIAFGRTTMEVEAVAHGRVAEILVPAGTACVRVDTPIAVLSGVGDGSAPHAAVAGSALREDEPRAIEREPLPIATSAPGSAAPLAPGFGAAAGAGEETARTAGDRPADAPAGAMSRTVTLTMREALREAIAEEMRRDRDVLLIGEEVARQGGAFKVAEDLLEEMGPARVVDAPITAQAFTGLAVGAALSGLKPVVEFMSWSFATQAIDQIVNSAAKMRYMSGGELSVPIVLRGPNGAGWRVAAQHAQCFSAWYAHVPGLKVVAPSNPADAKGLLKSAIRDPDPVLVLESERLYGVSGEVPIDSGWLVPIGRARIARHGRDVTIVSFARGVVVALEAAERLAADGIEAEVIDLRSLRPLDLETVLASVRRTNRIVAVEDAWPVCSIGSHVCAEVAMQAFDHLDAPPARVSGADVPMPYAANLELLALPDADRVVAAARAVLYL